MPYSKKLTSLNAICNECGREANYSQRLIDDPNSPLIKVGGEKDYEARCIKHFIRPVKNHHNS